jgi:predicted PhzF superfamily epimerase YddE/YHI9
VELQVLRVFVDDAGRHGNPLGVVLNGASVPPARRQSLAAELGFSETVFVDDPDRGAIRIFTPAAEVAFAGHPSVGTAWLLRCDTLRPPAGEVPVRRDGELTWIAGRPEWAPPFEHTELGSPADVDDVSLPAAGLAAYWAWEDEPAGAVRARVFPVALGIDEDEATGAAAVRLGALLGRELTIRQGRGSLIHARPREDGMVEVGGRVVRDSRRELPGNVED